MLTSTTSANGSESSSSSSTCSPMTVLDNVTLAPRKVLGVSRSDSELGPGNCWNGFGLADKATDYPDRLSGGQQQRVAIVRALAMKPQVMLFDEGDLCAGPIAGRQKSLDVIRELKQEGMTIVMATHEMSFAQEVADRVCFLDAGRVLEQAPPAQLFVSAARDDAQLPRPGGADLTRGSACQFVRRRVFRDGDGRRAALALELCTCVGDRYGVREGPGVVVQRLYRCPTVVPMSHGFGATVTCGSGRLYPTPPDAGSVTPVGLLHRGQQAGDIHTGPSSTPGGWPQDTDREGGVRSPGS